MKIKRRAANNEKVELRAEGDEEMPVIEGYAAVYYDGTPETEYELWDGAVERIMPGSFDRAISEGHDVRALFNHDPSLLLGRTASGTLKLSVDDKGLKYEVTPGNTTAARDTVEHLKRGDMTGSSFAFRPTSHTWRDEGELEILEINDVDLFDVGPVTYPAYTGASSGLRSEDEIAEARKSHEKWKSEATDDGAELRKRKLRQIALRTRNRGV